MGAGSVSIQRRRCRKHLPSGARDFLDSLCVRATEGQGRIRVVGRGIPQSECCMHRAIQHTAKATLGWCGRAGAVHIGGQRQALCGASRAFLGTQRQPTSGEQACPVEHASLGVHGQCAAQSRRRRTSGARTEAAAHARKNRPHTRAQSSRHRRRGGAPHKHCSYRANHRRRAGGERTPAGSRAPLFSTPTSSPGCRTRTPLPHPPRGLLRNTRLCAQRILGMTAHSLHQHGFAVVLAGPRCRDLVMA